MKTKPDFKGIATAYNVLCSDGITIDSGAFSHMDGQKVPLVWNHDHKDPTNVLGHVILHSRDGHVDADMYFLEGSEKADVSKALIKKGSINQLSIYANKLKKAGGKVVHGMIREVSVVLGGANPMAYIDPTEIQHSSEGDIDLLECILYHNFDVVEEIEHNDDDDILNSFSEEQLDYIAGLVGNALATNVEETINKISNTPEEPEESKEGDDNDKKESMEQNSFSEGGLKMKKNLFENNDGMDTVGTTITHSELMSLIEEAKQGKTSLKNVAIKHGFEEVKINDVIDDDGQSIAHGMTQMDYLFPDAKNIRQMPLLIKRRTEWVDRLMSRVGRTPFSRVKSLYANIEADEARAKGYIKGDEKVEETLVILRRSVSPTTIYAKQEFDRDDVVDITDFDVIVWVKGIMRGQLDEEIGRAILIGDGRPASSRQHINQTHVIPVWTDDDLYTIKREVVYTAEMTEDDKARAFIKTAIRARKDYKGSGSPDVYTTEEVLTECLLIEDLNKRIVYDTMDKLTTALRATSIQTVAVMENATRTTGTGETAKTFRPLAIILNPGDYNVGADKGGSVTMFDDFDIDFNQMKFLIETRISGALVVPYSAIAIETEVSDVQG